MSKKSQAKLEARKVRKDKDPEGHPKCDEHNVWHEDFGWILRGGKPTQASAAYWKMMRRKMQ